MNPSFIADVHLGKLAKALRLLGFDTIYHSSFTNEQLLSLAFEEKRMLLSRNIAFRRRTKVASLIITSEVYTEQVNQVIETLGLKNDLLPFTRCLVCNGKLSKVQKIEIQDGLPANTRQYYNEFWRCEDCNRIYWKGSHYERMQKMVQNVLTPDGKQS